MERCSYCKKAAVVNEETPDGPLPLCGTCALTDRAVLADYGAPLHRLSWHTGRTLAEVDAEATETWHKNRARTHVA